MTKPRPPQTTGHILIQHLTNLFQLPGSYDTAEAALVAVGRVPALALPWDVGSSRIVYDKFPLLGELTQPRRRSLLLDFLAETPDDVCLFTDAMLSGREALFFGAIIDQPDVGDWLRAQSFPAVYVNTLGQDLVILAPVKAFSN